MRKSNWIIAAVLLLASVAFLWIWHALQFDLVDNPLDIVVTVVWWAVIVAACVAIHWAEKKRQDHQERHDADIQGQQGGQELDFRHPAEPRVKRSGKIEEQQRRQHEEKGRGRNSDFS